MVMSPTRRWPGVVGCHGGQVQLAFYHPAAVMPHIKSGKFVCTRVSSARRSAAAPTFHDCRAGFGEFDLVAGSCFTRRLTLHRCWHGCATRWARSLWQPEVRAKLQVQGLELPAFKPTNWQPSAGPKWPGGPNSSNAQALRSTSPTDSPFPSPQTLRRQALPNSPAATFSQCHRCRRRRAARSRRQRPGGAPLRIGSTLMLTGPLSATAPDPQAGGRNLRGTAEQARGCWAARWMD